MFRDNTLTISETSKTKKRVLPDATSEWTGTMVKFLKEQLSDIGKLIQAGGITANLPPPSSSSSSSSLSPGQ